MVDVVINFNKFPPKNLQNIREYLVKSKPKEKEVSGVRFCYLVKGRWMIPPALKDDVNAVKVTYNPLIRGYRYHSPSGVAYAHSWNYPNPENRSGMSKLGSGWEPFNVWESDISIKQWVTALNNMEVQPDCGDIVRQQVIVPPEYFRGAKEIEVAIKEITGQESRINQGLRLLDTLRKENKENEANQVLDDFFPHHRKHCEFHFGDKCEYHSLCFDPVVGDDPMGSGLYQVRMPHHEYEREKG